MLINTCKLISLLLIIQLISILKPPIVFSQQLNEAKTLTLSQKKEVRDLIKKFIKNNPELIVQSVQKMRKKNQRQISDTHKKNIKKYKNLIFYDNQTPVIGNPNGDITIVEFFDYNCGYCKSSLKVIKKLLKEDTNIRFVLKELPILTPSSEFAARVALTSWIYDKTLYEKLHYSFMSMSGKLSKNRIMGIAKSFGVSEKLMKKKMFSDPVNQILENNKLLANKLGISGTPGFIIDTKVIPGAIELSTFREIILEIRSK
tara:strand:- start:15331 stop:16107 length:777 start_codon:yes stop_codon:yes gene_type:complete